MFQQINVTPLFTFIESLLHKILRSPILSSPTKSLKHVIKLWCFFLKYIGNDGRSLKLNNDSSNNVWINRDINYRHLCFSQIPSMHDIWELPHGIAAHTGTVMDGVPVICGGFTTDTDDRCFKLNKTSHYWVQVSSFYKNIKIRSNIHGIWLLAQ